MGAPAVASSEWAECLVPPTPVSPALAREVRRHFGAVPGWLPRLAPSPWITRALCEFVGKPVAYVPPALYDLISLVVSQDNSCRYCYGVQRAVMKILGYRLEYIDRLVRDFHAVELSRAERTALEFARKLSRANPPPGRAELEELVGAGFSRPAAAEIAVGASASTFANRVATLLALPPESLESFVERPLFRLVRPLIARRMRARPRAPEPPPQPNDGPCAPVVAALGDSPAAGAFRRVIDGAWASDVLPRRTKSLMLAVIGKALGSAYAEGEARRLLEPEGFAPPEVDEVLTNLGSSRLDRREARLVPFARETVRYQPAAIQRRVHELAMEVTADELLEAVGIAALANAVCRLSVVLDAG